MESKHNNKNCRRTDENDKTYYYQCNECNKEYSEMENSILECGTDEEKNKYSKDLLFNNEYRINGISGYSLMFMDDDCTQANFKNMLSYVNNLRHQIEMQKSELETIKSVLKTIQSLFIKLMSGQA